MKKSKRNDCVKMMRDIRNQIYQETKTLSSQDFLDKLKKEIPELHKNKKG